MSHYKSKLKDVADQPSIRNFCKTPEQQHLTSENIKKRTPPEMEDKRTNKRLIQSPDNTQTPINDAVDQDASDVSGDKKELSPEANAIKEAVQQVLEVLLLPLKKDIKDMLSAQKEFKEDLFNYRKVNEANKELEQRVAKVEAQNKALTNRICDLENKMLDCNIILHGVTESAWETEEMRQEKVYDIISDTIIGRSYETKLEIAKTMGIRSTRRIGPYRSMRTRPLVVEFLHKSDANYVIQNRRYLCKGIGVDKEYCKETEENRRILRPYLRAARRLPKYHRKCKLEGDTLVIRGISYNKDTLNQLPDDLNGFHISSRSNENVFGFFSNLNPFSNFHPASFTYNKHKFHCSEQLIQYTKAKFFGDTEIADKILACTSAFESKKLSREITNFDRDRWNSHARNLCTDGIMAKFLQNEHLSKLLLSTESKTLVECCFDPTWGTGVPIHDNACLNPDNWSSQGILGMILEDIRGKLRYNFPSTVESESVTATASINPPPSTAPELSEDAELQSTSMDPN